MERVLRTIIISPDGTTAEHLSATLKRYESHVQVARVIDHYPNSVDLLRILRAHAPEVLFLSFQKPHLATETVRVLESQGAGLQIIGIHSECDANLLRESMRAGIREFLAEPFEDGAVAEALNNVAALIQRKPPTYESTNQIYTFVPSKAGVGTTTLALNIGASMARGREGSVLLTDLDLNSGMLRFLAKLSTEYSVVDAVENAAHIDENIWQELVTSRFGLDILHAGRVNPNLRIDPAQITQLIQFMRRNYQTLIFDVSGNLERYSLEVMQESRGIFIVCTPEIPSLHLAREKMGFLKTLGMDTKVSILLNRVSKRPLFTTEQVEELVGARVRFSFPNDYYAVSRATTGGQTLEETSAIGENCAKFVKHLEETKANPPSNARRKKFLEFFNVGAQQLIAQD